MRLFQKAEALRQPLPDPGARKQVKREVGILGAEAAQALGQTLTGPCSKTGVAIGLGRGVEAGLAGQSGLPGMLERRTSRFSS